jgi:WXG100 family type VII secretion target
MNETIYNVPALEEICTRLQQIQEQVRSAMNQLDGTMKNLNEGFISKTQEAFQAIHEEKRKDYDRLNALLDEMPKEITRSHVEMTEMDQATADEIRSRYLS